VVDKPVVTDALFSLKIEVASLEVVHHVTTYSFFDLLASVGGFTMAVYLIFYALIPSNLLLMDHISSQVGQVQSAGPSLPKFHRSNDAISEMLTVGKDTIKTRRRIEKLRCC